MNNPYETLGIPATASWTEAKRAYRKLASKHHPDKGGDTEKFKDIERAWSAIDSGSWEINKPKAAPRPEPAWTGATPKSSFSGGNPQKPFTQARAGDPAKGYEARNTAPKIPVAKYVKNNYYVTLEITEQQGFEGCSVPYMLAGEVVYHIVDTGKIEGYQMKDIVSSDDVMIGQYRGPKTVNIEVIINNMIDPNFVVKADHDMTISVCALALFTGGKITVLDSRNERVSFSIPPGFNPSETIILKGKGYGTDARGDLICTIEPTFTPPPELTPGELRQLKRLNEMTAK